MPQKTIDIPTFRAYYEQGMSDNQIGRLMGFHAGSIGYQRRKHDLPPNRTVKAQLRRIGKTKARCSKCNEVKGLSNFVINRKGGPYTYSLSYCHECRKIQVITHMNSSIEVFLRARWSRLRLKSKKQNYPFTISPEDLVQQFHAQSGKCFYTDEPLDWGTAKGFRRNALSVDRIVSNRGYVKGNIVLCTYKANAVKTNLTLDEMSNWLPRWYEKAISHLQLGGHTSPPGDT